MAISAEKSITRKCIRGHIDSSLSERFKMANLKVVLILGLICLPTIEPYFARYVLENHDPYSSAFWLMVAVHGRRKATELGLKDPGHNPINKSKHSTNNLSFFLVTGGPANLRNC